VQVVVVPAAKEVAIHAGLLRVPDPLKSLNFTARFDTATGPFVTVWVYVTVSPAFNPEAGLADDVNDKLGGTANVTLADAKASTLVAIA